MRGDLIAMLPIVSGDAVLDLGCGAGYWSALAASRVGPRGQIRGIDADPESIALAARRRDEHVLKDIMSFDCMDLAAFEPEPASADVVLLFNVLSYLREPGAALEKALKTLRPGGRCFVKDTDIQTDFFHPVDIDLRANVMKAALSGPNPALVGNFDPFFAKGLPVLLRRDGYRMTTWSQSFSVFAPVSRQERVFISANAAMLAEMAASNGATDIADTWFEHFRDDRPDPVYDRTDFIYAMNEFVFQLTPG